MDWPFVGAAVGALGAGLSYFSAQSQNEEARRQFDQSLSWQKQQYNDMKRYNSPQNQIRMMREAGINPALALGQLPSSAAVGSPASGSTASMVQPDFSGLNTSAEYLANYETLNSQRDLNYADAASKLQDSLGKGIDNAYKARNYELAQNLTSEQANLLRLNAEFTQRNMGNALEFSEWQAEEQRAKAGISLLLQKYVEPQQQAEIANKWMTALNAFWTGSASLTQARAAMMNAVTNRNTSDALYGDSKEARRSFYNLAMDLTESNSYKNWLTPAMSAFGTSVPTGLGISRANNVGQFGNRWYAHPSNHK